MLPHSFSRAYHTNIYHALIAASAQWTGAEYLVSWSALLPWAKLLSASGVYFLSWTMFRSRAAAGLAAVLMVILNATTQYLPYPNQLAPWWLFPLAIAFVVQLSVGDGWRVIFKLAAVSLVLSQVHSLYALFVIIGVAPWFALKALMRWRNKVELRRYGWALLALLVAFPFLLATRYVEAPGAQLIQPHSVEAKPMRAHRYLRLESGLLMFQPRRALTLKYCILYAGIIVALLGRRRRRAAAPIAIATSFVGILFIPWFCSAAIAILGRPWMLERIEFFVGSLGGALISGVMVLGGSVLWAQALRHAARFALIAYGVLPLEPWAKYLGRVDKSWDTGPERLAYHLKLAKNFRRAVPKGQTVAAPLELSRRLVMLTDAYVIASDRASPGIRTFYARRWDAQKALAAETPLAERQRIWQQYEVRHALITRRQRKRWKWLKPLTIKSVKLGRYELLTLRVERQP